MKFIFVATAEFRVISLETSKSKYQKTWENCIIFTIYTFLHILGILNDEEDDVRLLLVKWNHLRVLLRLCLIKIVLFRETKNKVEVWCQVEVEES